MKALSWDKQLGLALPLERAAGQSNQTNNPSKNEVGLDVSHHTRIFPRGGESEILLLQALAVGSSRPLREFPVEPECLCFGVPDISVRTAA